ncbi:MAG: hypothetical protein ABSG65_10750 [Bryobacteraceae bacterium]|jgi:hypothetical protein
MEILLGREPGCSAIREAVYTGGWRSDMPIPTLSPREKVVLTTVTSDYGASVPEIVLSARLGPSEALEAIRQLVAKDLLLERGAGEVFQLTEAGRAVRRQLTSKTGLSSFVLSSDEAERSPADIDRALDASIGNLN